ncbi:MAG: superoxide dismutase, Ni [Candidatus Marinimicrobia bacterium]|nr:superoxide dismutase, Ni [Candidatus Neomarinimicrobiota bacterium]
MKNVMKWCLLAVLMMSMITPVFAHCEIPCGIYGDSLRFELIREHVLTIEKSMKMINELSTAEQPDYNQLVRWVNNKDEHAEKIQDIVSQYFLHQRVKPVKSTDKAAYTKYTTELELLHKISISAMKCKQGTDPVHPIKIRQDLKLFEDLYFGKHEH